MQITQSPLISPLAIASSRLDRAVPPDTAAVGEIGLGGEIRRVSRLDVRVAEAARLGFSRMLVPAVCHAELTARVKAGGRRDAKCELVPMEAVAQVVDWLERNGVEKPF